MLTATLSPPTETLGISEVPNYHERMSSIGPSLDTDYVDPVFVAGTMNLREVYDAHGALVYSICRRSLNEADASEVTQDVFTSAWRGRDQFDPSRGTVAAWLVGITKRRIIDHIRAQRRHVAQRADEDINASGSSAATSDQVADRMLVADALRSLPERTRQAIELAYLHDMTHDEIAHKTGVPLGTIKSDIRRGLLRIRHYVEATHG